MKSFSLLKLFDRLTSRSTRPVCRSVRRRIAPSEPIRSAEVLEERRVMSASPVASVADFGVARAEGRALNWSLNNDADALGDINFEYGVGNGTRFNSGKPDIALAGDLLGRGYDQQIVVRTQSNGKLLWLVNTDTDADAEYSFVFGKTGDIPLVGDFNGDGRDDPAAAGLVTVDPVDGRRYSDPVRFWSIHEGSLPQTSGAELSRDDFYRWGFINDRLVVGDWDGDGKDTPGLASRQATPAGLTRWWIIDHGTKIYDFGFFTDKPVVGDWDGDGRDNLGVVREGAGVNGLSRWLLDTDTDPSRNTAAEIQFDYGIRGDQYVVGQWTKPGINVTPTSGLQTTEAGGTATFSVVLTAAPTSNVVIPISTTNAREGAASVSQLVFTRSNWNEPQTVTVRGVDDSAVDGDVRYSIITGAATSSDPRYQGRNADDVQVTNRDNDVVAINVTPTSGLQTTESGGTATFSVVLSAAPTGNVTIPISTSDVTEGTASVSQLVFTPSNWNRPQTVTVRGVDDTLVDGNIGYSIITGAATSRDSRYQGRNAADVSLTNLDNDVRQNVRVVPTYADGAGEGFNDPNLGAARRQALEFALGIWSAQLTSSYSGETITVIAAMNPGSANSSFIAFAGSTSFYDIFGGGLADTAYGAALANHLAGRDLDTTLPEIEITFNSDFSFYYGTDGLNGNNIDFITVALHEVAHGLNFQSLIDQSGEYFFNEPGIWDRQLEIGNGTDLTAMTPGQRAQALVSDNLFWNGVQGAAGNAGQRPKIEAPNQFRPGSSTSHLDEGVHANELLSPNYSGVDHAPSRMELGMLVDMGWNVNGLASPATARSTIAGPATALRTLRLNTFVANSGRTQDTIAAAGISTAVIATPRKAELHLEVPQANSASRVFANLATDNAILPLSRSSTSSHSTTNGPTSSDSRAVISNTSDSNLSRLAFNQVWSSFDRLANSV